MHPVSVAIRVPGAAKAMVAGCCSGWVLDGVNVVVGKLKLPEKFGAKAARIAEDYVFFPLLNIAMQPT